MVNRIRERNFEDVAEFEGAFAVIHETIFHNVATAATVEKMNRIELRFDKRRTQPFARTSQTDGRLLTNLE